MLSHDELQDFLKNDWRKQCRVFRGAINPTSVPLTAAGLCELTADARVESRMVTPENSVVHGPFAMQADQNPLLPAQHLLMVQCLEQLLPDVADMLTTSFDFIPSWQVDDVMASIGDSNASCGAHFDHYDVFLVQHSGRKIWHLDDGEHAEEDLHDDVEVRLLQQFEPTRTLEMEPGDVLYVPPGFGHHGICDGSSITLSVGIRNPTHAELLDEIATHALLKFGNSVPLNPRLFAGGTALPHDLIDEFTRAVHAMLDESVLMRWYGCYVTRLREPALLAPASGRMGNAQTLVVTLPSRIAWTQDDRSVLLFANGEVFDLPAMARDWVPAFCRERQIDIDNLQDEASKRCIEELVDAGVLQ